MRRAHGFHLIGNAVEGTGFQLIQFIAYMLMLGCIFTPPFMWYDVLIIEVSVALVIWSARNRWRITKDFLGVLRGVDAEIPKPET